MTKHITRILRNSSLFIALLAGFLLASAAVMSPAEVAAQSKREVCEGLGGSFDGTTCTTSGGGNAESTVKSTIEAALNIISIVMATAAVIMIMMGGFRYITSGGDASKTSSAQSTILWALIGLVIVALAQIIVRFILGRLPQ